MRKLRARDSAQNSLAFFSLEGSYAKDFIPASLCGRKRPQTAIVIQFEAHTEMPLLTNIQQSWSSAILLLTAMTQVRAGNLLELIQPYRPDWGPFQRLRRFMFLPFVLCTAWCLFLYSALICSIITEVWAVLIMMCQSSFQPCCPFGYLYSRRPFSIYSGVRVPPP